MINPVILIAPHPTQYHCGIYRQLMISNDFDFEVLYLDHVGVEAFYEKEFDTIIKWDIDLMKGYKYSFEKNFSFNRMGGFFSRVNFGIISFILKKKPYALVVHGYSTFSDIFAIALAKIFRIKLIIKGEATLANGYSLKKKLVKKIVVGLIVRMSDAILYSCTGNKLYWTHFGADQKKLFPFPCAVDNDFFRNALVQGAQNKPVLRVSLGVSPDDLLIIFSARFTSRKRPLDLIKAVSEIENENIKILFIGNGPLLDEMKTFSLLNNVKSIFVGFKNQSEISSYYMLGDLAVICSEYDPSPKVLNEVMNFNIPVIATKNIGTALDLVCEDVNGYLVNSGDVSYIGSKINYLNKNRLRLKEMGLESGKIVSAFTYDKCRQGLEQALVSLRND
jgi:glycosyltransferase involved in cell wall biosynthesis